MQGPGILLSCRSLPVSDSSPAPQRAGVGQDAVDKGLRAAEIAGWIRQPVDRAAVELPGYFALSRECVREPDPLRQGDVASVLHRMVRGFASKLGCEAHHYRLGHDEP